MKQFIVFLGLLSVAVAAPGNFSYHPTVGGRIVGGDEADIRELPYQVALLRNGAQFCGAAIIGPDTVATAAHCVAPSLIPNVALLNVRVGSSQWNSGGQRIAARQITYHELYQDCENCSPDYDIAVVKLAERINVPHAVPIQMVHDHEPYHAGTYAKISGWGRTVSGGSTSPVTLRKVNVPIITEERCRAVYGSVISNRMVCAGYTRGGKDSCQGDSGGPFVVDGKLAGIVSFGAGCAMPVFPGVYANIATYRDWIRRHSGI